MCVDVDVVTQLYTLLQMYEKICSARFDTNQSTATVWSEFLSYVVAVDVLILISL